MTTSEQAALLTKHGRHESWTKGCGFCRTIFPCDVQLLIGSTDAQLASLTAEIAELRRENGELALKLAFRSGDLAALKSEREAIVDWLQQTIDRPDNAEYGMVEYAQELIAFIRSFSSEGEQ